MVVVGEKFGGRESKREKENDITPQLFFFYCFFFFFFLIKGWLAQVGLTRENAE
jgi:hypothetical protein